MPREQIDWRYALVHYMHKRGVKGVKQRDLAERFCRWAKADEVRSEMECLRVQGKVQQYRIPTGKNFAVLWRATETILD